MIEWMAQAAPLRDTTTVKKMNDRSFLFSLNKITHYFKTLIPKNKRKTTKIA